MRSGKPTLPRIAFHACHCVYGLVNNQRIKLAVVLGQKVRAEKRGQPIGCVSQHIIALLPVASKRLPGRGRRLRSEQHKNSGKCHSDPNRAARLAMVAEVLRLNRWESHTIGDSRKHVPASVSMPLRDTRSTRRTQGALCPLHCLAATKLASRESVGSEAKAKSSSNVENEDERSQKETSTDFLRLSLMHTKCQAIWFSIIRRQLSAGFRDAPRYRGTCCVKHSST